MAIEPQLFDLDSFINQIDAILKSSSSREVKLVKLAPLFAKNLSTLKSIPSSRLSVEQEQVLMQVHSMVL